jgi:hypothetical protein
VTRSAKPRPSISKALTSHSATLHSSRCEFMRPMLRDLSMRQRNHWPLHLSPLPSPWTIATRIPCRSGRSVAIKVEPSRPVDGDVECLELTAREFSHTDVYTIDEAKSKLDVFCLVKISKQVSYIASADNKKAKGIRSKVLRN